MRLSTYVLPASCFGLAVVLSIIAAGFAVNRVESASQSAIVERFQSAGLDWASADATGLQVFVIGTAPNEADRFRALSNAGQIVDAARLIDQMDVAETGALAPPRFSVEILRNDSGVSLIGLVPKGARRKEIIGRLHTLVGADNVSDLLETAQHDVPDGWEDAVRFALDALDRLPRSKISVEAGRVEVTAMTDSATDKRDAEKALRRAKPEGLRVNLQISAPRPVITPFTLRYVLEEGEGRFDSCSADTEGTRATILKSARKMGLKGRADCTLGLGMPSARWAEAAGLSFGALHQLGGGSVTFSNTDVSLIAREGTDPALFDRTVGGLENTLPPVFDLTAVLPKTPDENDDGPPDFSVTLSPEGQVRIGGRISNETARQTAESYARAAFAGSPVHMTARLDENLPASWPARALAGIEALSYLANGSVTLTPDSLAIRGKTGRQDASAAISGLLSEKLGDGAAYTIDVTYDETLDPEAGLPTPEECLSRILAVQGARELNFEPGSDTLDSAGRAIMDDIAEVLKACGPINLEIAGHTDSQGRESMNLRLSQTRANAILEELGVRRVLSSTFRAKGYGETQPIASNKTKPGREANRRIEFKLIPAQTPEETETTLESAEKSGDEGDAPAAEDGAQ